MANSTAQKLRVAVLYGGQSGEHEISLRSAYSVMTHLDRDRFDIIPIAIDKQGHWFLNQLDDVALPNQSEVLLHGDHPKEICVPQKNHALANGLSNCDVIFPVLHGPLYEDGCLQGLLTLANCAYVGSNVLASAVAMDKVFTKRLLDGQGIKTVPYHVVHRRMPNRQAYCRELAETLQYPVFVKPASCGSSLATHKVEQASALQAAIDDALQYDHKALVESAIDAQEIEIAVLENPNDCCQPLVSTPGEIRMRTDDFYSYDAKYLSDDAAELIIPAEIDDAVKAQVKAVAAQVFCLLECSGMARVDFFLDKNSGELYFNELNTLPGFTTISMYPKLWAASGVPYSDLLSKLIDCAVQNHQHQTVIKREKL